MGAADRRIAYRDELGNLRSRVTRARRVLEALEVHKFSGENIAYDPSFKELYEAIRDALDVLNRLPPGYWRKKPIEYRFQMAIDDLGVQEPPKEPSTGGER